MDPNRSGRARGRAGWAGLVLARLMLARLMLAGLMLAGLAVAAPGAAAQVPGPRASDEVAEVAEVVVLSGPAHVREGELAQNVLAFEGPIRVDGRVLGDAVALSGDVRVAGRVDGDVVAVSGRVILGPRARVGGDVASARAPIVAEGARIGGEVGPMAVPFQVERPLVEWFLASWLSVTVSLLVLGLILFWLIGPRGTGALYAASRRHPGRSILTGLIAAVGIPIVALFGILSIVGAPLALMLLFGLGLLASLGYLASAWLLGRWTPELLRVSVTRWPPVAWFLVGFGLLRILALIPFVRPISWVVASILGLGAILFAAWRRRRPPTAEERPPAVPRGAPVEEPAPG
jgi:hypothetical protein